jgi:ribosome biogenesis GTPase A
MTVENPVLSPDMQTARLEVDELVKDLHQLTIDIRHEDLAKTVSSLRNRIHEPFLFVVVGEVKSGKSSFINALLESDKEICKVAPDPCTDTIQEIIYGEKEETIVINEHLKKILMPVEVLQEIAIVDTPGTNTIISHHQAITENFVPGSDLIVFVFEAKNPYRQSAWEFFDYIHEKWRKKVIFVLQQADLMDEKDLKINQEGVIKQAQKLGIPEPHVYAVSAKRELEGKQKESGFAPLRKYIRENITGGQAPLLKLKNNLATTQNILDSIAAGLTDRRAQWEADQHFRQEVRDSLDEQAQRSNKQVEMMVENLLAEYDRTTRQSKTTLKEGLGFFALAKRSLSSAFSSKTPGAKAWLKGLATELEENMNRSLDQRLRDGVGDIAASIQQMAKIIDLKIKQSPTVLKDDHEIFGRIADRRSEVFRELQEQFQDFIGKSENFTARHAFEQDPAFSPNVAAGTGIATVGVVMTALGTTAALDITGGVITAVGVIFAGATVAFKRRSILKAFQDEIEEGRGKLESKVTERLQNYVADIKTRLDDTFDNFDAMLANEAQQLQGLEQEQQGLEKRLKVIENRLVKE